MSLFGFGRVKPLQKRLQALESFLGLRYVVDEDNWSYYELTASQHDGKVDGVIGKLIAAQREEEMAKRKAQR